MRPILPRLFPFLTAALLLAGVVPAGAHAADAAPYWVFFTDRGALNTGKALAAKRTSAAEPKNRSRRARVRPPERLFDESDLPVNSAYIEAVAGYAARIRTVTRFMNGVSAELDGPGLAAVRALSFVREVRPVAVMEVPPEPRTGERVSPGRGKTAAHDYGQSLDQLTIADIIRVHDNLAIVVFSVGFNLTLRNAENRVRYRTNSCYSVGSSVTGDNNLDFHTSANLPTVMTCDNPTPVDL